MEIEKGADLLQARICYEARPRSAPNVRFTPKSGHTAGCKKCPLSANSGHRMPFGADCSIFLNRFVRDDIAECSAIHAASALELECRGWMINA